MFLGMRLGINWGQLQPLMPMNGHPQFLFAQIVVLCH